MRRILLIGILLLMAQPSWASRREGEDLRREIDTQRAGVGDLERLDTSHVATAELTLLRAWLDEANTQLAKEDYDRTREVIDRCLAEAELIRQMTTAGRMTAQANERENALKKSREKVQKTKEAIQQAQVNKKALEMNTK